MRTHHPAMAPLKLEWETPLSPLGPELSYPYGAPLAASTPGAYTTPNGRLVSDGSLVNTRTHAPRASPRPEDTKLPTVVLDTPSSWVGYPPKLVSVAKLLPASVFKGNWSPDGCRDAVMDVSEEPSRAQ